LAAEVSWTEPLVASDVQAEKSLAAVLDGKSVAIYTLTEGASRNARDQLRELAPDLHINLITIALALVVLPHWPNARDLFVIAALSATHAATDFIRTRCSS
jgi:hypothetical protein